MRSMHTLAAPLLAAAVCGCQALSPPPPPPQVVNVRVHSDPGKPIAAAELVLSGRKVGTTDARGIGQLTVQGKYGDSFELAVRCPKEYQSPGKPILVTLRRLDQGGTAPEYTAACPPKKRTVVVAVRAMNVADVPVMYLGREVARTDESGAAHVMLKLPPGDTFDLVLDTTDERHGVLRPESPVASFVVGQRDEVFSFDQKFEAVRPAVVRAAPAPLPVKVKRRKRFASGLF